MHLRTSFLLSNPLYKKKKGLSASIQDMKTVFPKYFSNTKEAFFSLKGP